MRRREFFLLLGCATMARPTDANAQQAEKMRRIGFLWDGPTVATDGIQAFRQGLRELNWVEGRNISIEYRWTQGKPEQMRESAEELVRLKVDVIVAPSSVYVEAAKRATSTTPIIFLGHADPIGSGHVASLSHPGGNATGLSIMLPETNAKGLQLLKDTVPGLMRIAVIFDPATPSHGPGLKAVEAAGSALGFQIQSLPVRNAAELDSAFAAMARERAGAVVVLLTPIFIAQANRLAELASSHKLPSMFGNRGHTEAGGLMSYGPHRAVLWHRGAYYVHRILQGANAADLAVQQPTKFELVINLKTAKVLGLTVPPYVLALADEIIE